MVCVYDEFSGLCVALRKVDADKTPFEDYELNALLFCGGLNIILGKL